LKLIDKRCDKCGKVEENIFDIENKNICECGGNLLRLYSVKPEIFKAGMYENFEAEPIYIETKKQFQQELDKRGLVRVH
jgi:hypothetical protein